MDAVIDFEREPRQDYRIVSDRLIKQWLFDAPYHTKRMYRRTLERLCQHSHRSPILLDLEDIQTWITSITGTVKPETICYYKRILKSWFSFITAQRAIPYNPLDGVRVATHGEQTKVERALTVDETRRLMEHAPNPMARFALELLYHAGLRRAELVRLRWRDITFANGAELDVLGKGNKRRIVRIGPGPLVDFMKANKQRDDRLIVPRCGETLRAWVKQAIKDAGLPPEVTPHWLRHSRISHLVMAGLPREEVRDFAGHSSGYTTELYNHALRKIAMPDTLGESDE